MCDCQTTMMYLLPWTIGLLLSSPYQKTTFDFSKEMQVLKTKKILVVGDSLGRRFTAHLAYTLENKESELTNSATKKGWHSHASYDTAAKKLDFHWAPKSIDVERKFCHKMNGYEVVFLSLGVHDLEELPLESNLYDYKSLVSCLCNSTPTTSLIVWRLPNEPKNAALFKKNKAYHFKFMKQRGEIIKAIENGDCNKRFKYIDANAMVIDDGDSPEHTGRYSRRMVMDRFFSIVGKHFGIKRT